MAPKPWISIPNIKIYLETKFRPNRRIFAFWQPFWIQNGRNSKPTMDINSQHHNLLGNQISPKSEIFVFWRPFWIPNGRHSKPTMHINSQNHNLLGNQISPKSEDFCNWRPFCTMVTMVTAAILNSFNPKSCHTLRWIFLQILMKGIQFFLNPPLFCFHGSCGKVCPTDSDFFGLSRSTRCGCCSY